MMLKKLTALSAGLMVSLATWAAPTVEITTSLGAITLELYPEKAPRTVEMFLYNAKHGFYESTIFHRVIDGFMIQGGGFNQSMTEKKVLTPALKSEANNGLSNDRGTVAMARTLGPTLGQSSVLRQSEGQQFPQSPHNERPAGLGLYRLRQSQ
jgi:cyclophilin family peptidyl-prolyl cis-trans isomerase